MSKAIIGGIILLATAIVFGTSILLIKLWSGRPIQSILADRKQLFLFSLKLAVGMLVVSIIFLVIKNN
ncbi:MAG: hypothetical protein ABI980_00860 [Nitrospirota bacterium]